MRRNPLPAVLFVLGVWAPLSAQPEEDIKEKLESEKSYPDDAEKPLSKTYKEPSKQTSKELNEDGLKYKLKKDGEKKKASKEAGGEDKQEPQTDSPSSALGDGSWKGSGGAPGATSRGEVRTRGEAASETVPEAAAHTQRRAMDRAARAAETFKKGLPPTAEDMPRTEFTPSASRFNKAPTPRLPSNPANPETRQDLMLASVSGFAGVFKAAGLRVGQTPGGEQTILRSDGLPASERELDKLRDSIEAEPAALMRRPDFFSVLPRNQHQDLKKEYQNEDMRESAFKDIGLTEKQRDFLWSASCDKISGDCNKFVQETSYKKGEDVAPEDLRSIWTNIQASAEELDEGETTEEEKAQLLNAELAEKYLLGVPSKSPMSLSGLLGRLESALGAVGSIFGGSPGEAPAVAAGGAESRQAGVTSARGRALISGKAPKASQRLKPPVPTQAARAASQWSMWAAAAVVGVVLLILGLRRREN